MQFAKRYPFEVSFKVAKLQGDAVSRNLSPDSISECHLRLRPAAPQPADRSPATPQSGHCEVYLVCKCGDRASFAYVEAHLAQPAAQTADSDCGLLLGGLVQRFDSGATERLLGRAVLPTIGRNARYLAANLRLTGHLLVEDGCGPDLFAPDEISDVQLLVEGRELHLHRSLLAKTSPVFRAMLLGCFREGQQQQQKEAIELPGKSLSLFVELLATVYPPQLEMHSGRARHLLPLLVEYQMDHLLGRCERALLQSAVYTLPDCRGFQDPAGEDPADIGPNLPQSWMEELLEHACLATVYQLRELQGQAVSLLATAQLTAANQATLKELLPDEILCRIFARRVSLLEGKIGRLSEELERYRSQLAESEG